MDIAYLNALSQFSPYLITLSRTIPYLNTLSRTVPYLNALSRTIPYLNTLNRIHADLALGSQSIANITSPESSANQNRALRHPKALGCGGGPFSALGSSRFALVYLST